MIQFFWLIDFVGIFLSRLIIAFLFFIFFLKTFANNKIFSFIYLISALLIFLGLYTSFISLTWVLGYIFKMVNEKKINIFYLSLVAYFILLISVGPGKLSLDRIFDIRYF